MYLRGLRGMNSISLKNPTDGSIKTVSASDPNWLQNFADLYYKQHYVPVRPDGSAYEMREVLGGLVADDCPLNVLIGNGWVPGQIEAMKAIGMKPQCLAPGSAEYTQFYGAPTTTPGSGQGAQPTIITTGVPVPTIQPQPGGGVVYTSGAGGGPIDLGDNLPPDMTPPTLATQIFSPLILFGIALFLLGKSSGNKG